MNSWFIRLGISKGLSSLVRTKVECHRSHDHFSCWVMDSSATRILLSSIMVATHGQQVSSWESIIPLQRCSECILHPKLIGWTGIEILKQIFIIDMLGAMSDLNFQVHSYFVNYKSSSANSFRIYQIIINMLVHFLSQLLFITALYIHI